jgi:hypothetical protein
VLPTFNSANLEFHSEIPKIQYLYSKMSGAYKLLLSYYIKRDYLKNTDVTKLGVGGRGKYPGASPHIKKGKRGKKPTARYLIDQYGEKGKAIYIKKKKKKHELRKNC